MFNLIVMNGEAYGLTPDGYGHAAEVETGDTARVYMVTGGAVKSDA